ncbi:MAG: LysM peptidoglycan-binding domain-containing protein [Christensenellales bacterium]
MKEICFVNKGDNIQKLSQILGISPNSYIEDNKLFDNKYVVINNGEDDIICVKNYSPYFIKKISKENTLLDIYALGYEIVGNSNPEENDVVVVKKICGVRYIVKPLEKLDDISKKFGVDKTIIMQNNNLITEKLFVGQVLII